MTPEGRVVVVTGGGGGIGRALCERFAAEGARALVVADLDLEAARVAAEGVGGMAVRADVAVEEDVRELCRRALEAYGRIDVYCSNAGVGVTGSYDAPDDVWRTAWDVHVMAHVYAARAVVPAMRERGEGYVVGTVSAAGLLNHVLTAPYAVTKAAALSFLEWLSIAHGDEGVRVSAVCPQGVRTPMLAMDGDRSFLEEGAIAPEDVAAAVIDGMREERFLILPHPDVAEHMRRRAGDNERWLRGMRRLRRRALDM
jgi:NAD(P)-dependent dehydrogenase (short-subunit alcohol dehydrogenase family)